MVGPIFLGGRGRAALIVFLFLLHKRHSCRADSAAPIGLRRVPLDLLSRRHLPADGEICHYPGSAADGSYDVHVFAGKSNTRLLFFGNDPGTESLITCRGTYDIHECSRGAVSVNLVSDSIVQSSKLGDGKTHPDDLVLPDERVKFPSDPRQVSLPRKANPRMIRHASEKLRSRENEKIINGRETVVPTYGDFYVEGNSLVISTPRDSSGQDSLGHAVSLTRVGDNSPSEMSTSPRCGKEITGCPCVVEVPETLLLSYMAVVQDDFRALCSASYSDHPTSAEHADGASSLLRKHHASHSFLLIGLGGGTMLQWLNRYCEAHSTFVDVIEFDPRVIDLAENFFGVTKTPNGKPLRDEFSIYTGQCTNCGARESSSVD